MRRGYTLFELMLVMAIILIVSALASPLLLEGIYAETKITSAADLVRARWTDCRTLAIEEGRPYCFWVVPNTGKFKVEPYNLATNDNSDVDPMSTSGSSDLPKGFTKEDRLPSGIRFSTTDSPANADGDESDGSDYVPIAIFLPDGTAQADVEISFVGQGGNILKIKLRALTGTSITVRAQDEEGH
jgi:prepilin-type N-terminal cleavage/methylation domain-containing protein